MNNKGKVGFGEVAFIIALIAPLIPAIIAKQWYYVLTLATFYVCFIIFEIIAVKRTDKTISQHIGDLHRKNATQFWWIIGTWLLMALALPIHFLMM